MNKNKIRITTLAITALGLTACVKQLWQTHYVFNDNDYTYSETLVIGPDERSVVAGVTGMSSGSANDGQFIASFDASGTLLWQYMIPADAGNQAILASGKLLAVDNAGNSYFASADWNTNELRIYKFDANGELANEWLAAAQANLWADDLQVGPDNNIYLSALGGSIVQAYSTEGTLLWEDLTSNPSAISDTDLSPLSTEGAAEVASASPLSALTGGGSFSFLPDGSVLLQRTQSLRIYDNNGNVLASATPQDLGVDSFSDTRLVNEQIVTTAAQKTTGESFLIRLDASLAETGRTLLSDTTSVLMMDKSGSNVCVLTGDAYFVDNAPANFRISQYDTNGTLLASTDFAVAQHSYWEIKDMIGNGEGCVVSERFTDADEKVTTRITHVSAKGKAGDIIDMPDYLAGDIAVTGKDLIQVGITGEYDGSFTNVALTRHHRY